MEFPTEIGKNVSGGKIKYSLVWKKIKINKTESVLKRITPEFTSGQLALMSVGFVSLCSILTAIGINYANK